MNLLLEKKLEKIKPNEAKIFLEKNSKPEQEVSFLQFLSCFFTYSFRFLALITEKKGCVETKGSGCGLRSLLVARN
jgi:hypothetical protein